MGKTGPRRRLPPGTTVVSPVPHSWPVSNWPSSIYPNDSGKAKYLVREHTVELIEVGALKRVGRERVIFGAPYVRWLGKQTRRVTAYGIAPNQAPAG